MEGCLGLPCVYLVPHGGVRIPLRDRVFAQIAARTRVRRKSFSVERVATLYGVAASLTAAAESDGDGDGDGDGDLGLGASLPTRGWYVPAR